MGKIWKENVSQFEKSLSKNKYPELPEQQPRDYLNNRLPEQQPRVPCEVTSPSIG